MASLDDADTVRRLRKIYKKYAQGGAAYAGGGEVEGSFPRTRSVAGEIADAVTDYPSQLEMDRRRWLWDHANQSTGDFVRGQLGSFARVAADNLLPNSLADKAAAGVRSLRGDNYGDALREERAKTRQAHDYELDPYMRPFAQAAGTIPWLSPATGAAYQGLSALSNIAQPSHSFHEWADRVLGGPTLRDNGNTAYDAGKGLYDDTREALGFKSGGSTVTDVWRKVRDKFGSMQADRLSHAADEADLSRINPKSLYNTFDPKNSGLFVTMPPGEFQDYATRLPQSTLDSVPYSRWQNVPGGGRTSRDDQTLDNYLSRLGTHMQSKGAYEPPSLWLFKNPDGRTEVEGHEGRHRMMAMDRLGDDRSLVHLLPANRGEMSKPLDDRFDYLFDKYTPQGADSLIVPQYEILDSPNGAIRGPKGAAFDMINRPPTPLSYEPFAEGGDVHWPNLPNSMRQSGPMHYGSDGFAEGGNVLTKIARSIKGKPSTFKLLGETHDAAPLGEIEDVAAKIAAEKGRSYPVSSYPEFDEDRARRIAQAYGDMKHDPADPAVRRSYNALIDETMDQYKALSGLGLDFHFLRDGEADPYAKTPSLGYRDMLKNGRLSVFPTSQGYGTLSDIDSNPLLRRVGRIGDLDDATANDAFRVVHDVFGHNGPGNPFFRAKGEDRAWYAHSHLYSPDALPAATSELRGQNSWVNFGPRAEENRLATGADTTYADQKAGLLPDWAWEDAPKFREGGDTVEKIVKALRTRKAEKLQGDVRDLNRGVTPNQPFNSPPVDSKLQTVSDPQRVMFPGIYKDPRDVISQARDSLIPDPGKEGMMYRLFGHTRQSLDELSQGSRDLDSFRPFLDPGPVNMGGISRRGAGTSDQVLTRRNAGRVLDTLGLANEDPDLKVMRSWYEMSPLWDFAKRAGVSTDAQRALNTRMGVMSPASDPSTEIERGFAANYLANRGRLDDFVRYGGVPEHERDPSWFPRDMMNMRSHAYHDTAHVPNLLDFESSGQLWGGLTAGGKHKVPTYVAATDPELPYSDRPIADSHFARSWGYPDVRTAETKGVLGKELTSPEYGDMVPFYQDKVASPLDLRSRDAQALQWGVFGPQTGVQYVGPPKLELLSNFVDEAAQNRGISPEKALYGLMTSRIPGRARGGSIDDDMLNYHTMFFADGGRVADDMLLYHASEF